MSSMTPTSNRLPAVRGDRSDRFDGTVRRALAHPEHELSAVWRDAGSGARPQGVAHPAGCGAGGGAAAGHPARAGRSRAGGADGGRGGAGLDPPAGGGAHACFRCAPAPCCAGRRGCSGAGGRRHIGRRSICCRCSAQSPVDARVVVDGNWVFAAGVTAGIDGAFRLAAKLRGDARRGPSSSHMAYAPEPPFDTGTPESAPPPSWRRPGCRCGDYAAAGSDSPPCRHAAWESRFPLTRRMNLSSAMGIAAAGFDFMAQVTFDSAVNG